MKLGRILLNSIFILMSVLAFGQNETTAIEVYFHWIKDEVYAVLIKTTTTNILKEKTITYITTYNANFKVLEKSETEY